MNELLAFASAPAVIIVLVIALLIVATRLGWVELRLPGGLGATRNQAAASDAGTTVRALKIDLEQYSEVAAALSALVEADLIEVETAARQWFSELATRLATRLKEQRDHHYRVAIWLDDPNSPNYFVGIGRGIFDKGDTDMDTLERKYTIGGLAFDSPTMTYYCRDRRTDPNFKPRKHVPPSFESVFGLALGEHDDRWGVMTVDARQANGFPDDTQWLIQRFGELASIGALLWYSRVTPAGPSVGTTS